MMNIFDENELEKQRLDIPKTINVDLDEEGNPNVKELPKKIYISDNISVEEINKKPLGSNLFINAGTGTGKTVFGLTNVRFAAKAKGTKVLYLVHRNRIKQSITETLQELNKGTDHIRIDTYQKIVHDYSEKGKLISEEYGIIVCDEYHFFTDDSGFNYDTEEAFKIIMNASATRIFMSATPDKTFEMVQTDPEYKHLHTERFIIKNKFSSQYQLYPYSNEKSRDNQLFDIIERGKKALVFIDNKEKLYKVYNKFKDVSTFIISEHNETGKNELYKHVNQEEVAELMKTHKIPKQLIFTTSVMIEGVDIIDEDLETIFVETLSPRKAVQAIGRDRRRKVNVMVREAIARQIYHYKNLVDTKIRIIRLVERNELEGTGAYLNKEDKAYIFSGYARDIVDIDPVTGLIKSKPFSRARLEEERRSLEFIKEHGMAEAILRELNNDGDIREPLESIIRKMEVYEYAYQHLGERIHPDKQGDVINLVSAVRPSDDKVSSSFKAVNEWVKFYTEDTFYMQSKKERRRDHEFFDSRYWMFVTDNEYINKTVEIEKEMAAKKEVIDEIRFNIMSVIEREIKCSKYNDIVKVVNGRTKRNSPDYRTSVEGVQEILDDIRPGAYVVETCRRRVKGRRETLWILKRTDRPLDTMECIVGKDGLRTYKEIMDPTDYSYMIGERNSYDY